MPVSGLQRYILFECGCRGGKCDRKYFVYYYNNVSKPPKTLLRVKLVSRSLERLIDRGYLVGYGIRTPKKWFIKEVRLTRSGRKLVGILRGIQQPLPLVKK